MAKKITKKIKLQVQAAKATPAPPLGPALGQAGINIGDFVTKFNAATAGMAGDLVGVKINVFEDRTYDFVIKTPPVITLLTKAAGVAKGSGKPNSEKISKKLTRSDLKEIAEEKSKDMNTDDVEAVMKMVAGTARSMGVEIQD